MKTVAKLLTVLLVMTLLLTACNPKPTPEPVVPNGGSVVPKQDSLTVALRQEPPNLDPHNHTTLVGMTLQKVLYDGLVTIKDGSVVPKLATRWEVIDELTVRFFLREDVYFHNGEQLTAEDVRYSISRATEKPSSASLFSAFDGINTQVVNKFTVDVRVKYPFAPVFNYLASSRGDIYSKKAFEEKGEDRFGREPVGSGPFKFVRWVSGDRIELDVNPDYWGDQPAFSKLTYRIILEPANRAIELETGGIDAAFDIAANDIPRLKANSNIVILQGPAYRHNYITFNNQMAPFDDIRVRKAFVHAIDMEAIVQAVYKGTAQVADSFIPPTIFGYKKVGPYEYNPEMAKQLLADAGYANGLKVVFMTNDDRSFMDVAEAAQNMWAKVGIEVEIQIFEQATFLAKSRTGEVALGMSSTTAATGDPDHALMVWPSSFPGLLRTNDPKIDEYILRGKSAYDPKEREKVYNEALEYFHTLYAMLPVSFTDIVYATKANVANFEVHPGNTPNLATVTFK